MNVLLLLAALVPQQVLIVSARGQTSSAEPNVSPAFVCTWIWLIPRSRYSTGSSTVMMLRSGWLRMFSVAYRVVDLPEPVGPVTRIAP